MPLNPEIVLAEAKRALDAKPDADALREVRAAFDEPAFFAELIDYISSINDADVKARILSDLVGISRRCSDKSAERKNQLTNMRYGIGGGSALTIGGIVGMAASGAVLLLPAFFAGIWIAGISIYATGPISEEEQIYQDIANRTKKIWEKFDAS